MTEKLENVLVQLADKLSTTVPHLWEVLVKQAYISAIADIVFYFAIIINAVLCWKAHKWAVRKEKYKGYNNAEWYGLMGAYGFFSTALLIVLVCSFGNTITNLINPEYFALKQIFHSF